MDKTSIILLTPIPFWHIGTHEFIEQLQINNITVRALDIWSFNYYNEKGGISQLCPTFLKGIFSKIYIRLNRRRILKKYIKKNDTVDIHWCGYYYAQYMGTIKKQSKNVIATLFGSDIYRNTEAEKKKQTKIFKTADIIVMGQNMDEYFLKYFPQFKSKIEFGQYGSKRLSIVDEINSTDNKKKIRNKYQIAQNKLITTIGYNAKQEQQHLLFLEKLNTLSKEDKEKLFLLLPMTYGGEEEYVKTLKHTLNSLKIEYLCIEHSVVTGDKWLTNTEMAELWIISDITVNMQTTDALSSSIKEALVAGSVVITGDWLPYKIYEEMGVFLLRKSKNNIFSTFLEVMDNYDKYKLKTLKNKEIILDFAGWDKVITTFVKRYKSSKQ